MFRIFRPSYFFFFSSRRRHTRCSRDWSSDVCSSDLVEAGQVTNTGLFNGMSTMHQYDGQGYLLVSQPGVEPVVATSGRCPSTAPVRKYDIPPSDRKSTRLNSSHGYISYAVFCFKKKKKHTQTSQRATAI